jgi:GH35 family endo-1,4-beta-xylanase
VKFEFRNRPSKSIANPSKTSIMGKETNEVAAFKQFAEKELKNHIAELNTHYQNEPLASDELKQEAYKEHQKYILRN